ncbi:unnamed protein product [Boreogadus saida]
MSFIAYNDFDGCGEMQSSVATESMSRNNKIENAHLSENVAYSLHPGEREQRRWESDYLLGIKRVHRLYCNVGIGFHLQVRPDGSVNGVHRENLHSLIEISTVDRGVVSLFGVQSRRFVAMNRRGRLYGTAVFHMECMFKESLLANNYNAYESVSHPTFYIALTKHGRVKRGNRATTA